MISYTIVHSSGMAENFKQRTRRLIQAGGLIDVAGLGHENPELVLGLLLQARTYLDGLTPAQVNVLTENGRKTLEERRKEKEAQQGEMPAIGAGEWQL